MYKEQKMMEEIAHGLCDNYVKLNRPGMHQILTHMHRLPWTVVLANARGIAINFPIFIANIYDYSPNSSVPDLPAIISSSNI